MGKILFAYVLQSTGANKAFAEFWLPAASTLEYELISLEARKGSGADSIFINWESSKFGSITSNTKKRYLDGADAASAQLEVYRGDSATVPTGEIFYTYQTGASGGAGGAASRQRRLPFLLKPGNGLIVAPSATTGPLEVSTVWDERATAPRSWTPAHERFDPPIALGFARDFATR